MFEPERFVADCIAALAASSPQRAVLDVVERAMASPAVVERGLGTPKSAEIATLYRSDTLTVLNVVWAPCMTLYPHDHRMWAIIGLYGGREDNAFFKRTSGGVVPAGGKTLDTGDTILLGSSAIHSVTNPLDRFTGAIHVYGGDFFAVPRSEFDPVTLEERPYDVEKTRRAFAEANERAQRGDDQSR